MHRVNPLFAVMLSLALLPAIVSAQDAGPAATPAASACAAPIDPAAATPAAATIDQAALDAIAAIPLDRLPAVVSREEGAETGKLTLSPPGALSAIKLSTDVKSDSGGPIGRVEQVGNELVFSFDEITYVVAEIKLPMGGTIATQGIKLDPEQPSTLCVDLATGKITRNFHWLMTGTNVLYDASPTIALGDRGKATVDSVTKVDEDHYTIHLSTHWQSELTLGSWSLGGVTLPSGTIAASAEFEGTYTLTFDA